MGDVRDEIEFRVGRRTPADPHAPERGHERARGPVEGIVGAIGSTPLVRMRRLPGDARLSVWAKLESRNPGGSSKDRPAARMIADAIAAGEIGPDTTVIESSSGNMAIGLAQVCRYHGLDLICVVDHRSAPANLRILEALGADVRVVTEPDPQTGELLSARLNLVAKLTERLPDTFWPDQYSNRGNPAAHAAGTMREIDEALDRRIDHLIVAAGTAGTVTGCAEYLADHGRDTEIVAVDAEGSALFGGVSSARKLPGHGAGISSRHSEDARFDRLIRVTDVDCVVGCRRLAAREAIFAGASSGGVASALERIAPSFATGARCAVILPDGGASYLETVYDDGWVERELGVGPDELDLAVRGDEPLREGVKGSYR